MQIRANGVNSGLKVMGVEAHTSVVEHTVYVRSIPGLHSAVHRGQLTELSLTGAQRYHNDRLLLLTRLRPQHLSRADGAGLWTGHWEQRENVQLTSWWPHGVQAKGQAAWLHTTTLRNT